MGSISPFGVAIIVVVLGFTGGLLTIIYQNLNGKAKTTDEKLDKVKETYVTKEELNRYKDEHILDHNRQNKDYDKLDKKLDKIIQMLLEGRHEK